MRHECEEVRDAASAHLDGEVATIAPAAVAAHEAECPGCRDHLAIVRLLDRRLRLAPAPVVPDLSQRIIGAVDLGARSRRERQRRWVVALTGLVMVALAVPGGVGMAAAHSQREVAIFEAAIGLAVVLCAVRPRRVAPGVFPVVAAMSLLAMGTAIVDLSRGLTTPLAEVAHLPPVMAAILIWAWAGSEWRPPGLSRLSRMEPA